METYSLLLEGELRTVSVPAKEDLESWKARWTWAAVRMTGGTEEAAWRAALAADHVGLGWESTSGSGVVAAPKSFDACVFGAAPVGVSDMSLSDGMSRRHTPTHRGPPPHRAPPAKHGGSGSGGPHRPPTQRPTSSASSRPGHAAGAAHPRTSQPTPRQHATPGKVGWMGRDATKRPVPSTVPRA